MIIERLFFFFHFLRANFDFWSCEHRNFDNYLSCRVFVSFVTFD